MPDIQLDTSAGKVAGTYAEPRGGAREGAILFLHGWSSDAASGYGELPERLAERGFATLTIDLPGHGRSGGDRDRLSYVDLIHAATDAAGDLRHRSGSDRLTIIGTSLGGFLAARVAALRPVESLVLWVPTDFDDEFVEGGRLVAPTALTPQAFDWRSRLHSLADSATLRAFGGFRGRVLIVEAAEDELVPHQTIANYLAAASPDAQVDHLVLSGTTHILRTQPAKHALAGALTESWLTSPDTGAPRAARTSVDDPDPERSNILGSSARIYVDDLDAALPLYQTLAGVEHPHRFTYRHLRLASIGPFLLIEGADDEIRAHAATIAVRDIAAVARAVDEAGGELLDGPAPGPNGPRLIARHPDGNAVEYIQLRRTRDRPESNGR